MKVFVDSVGCRLNQSEIEAFANQFRAAGHSIVGDPAQADLVVVNTCAVTAEAASDSRQKIRQAVRAGVREVVATGCWASLEPTAAAEMRGVSRVIANPEKDGLVGLVLNQPQERFDLEPVAREPLPGMHMRTRAFLKVQDGCDNHCTFCVTRVARGASHSYSIAQVLNEAHQALAGGARELVLTGVHLGSWGQDFPQPAHLKDLIRAVLRETDVPRLRLSSLEPWDLDEEFFSLWEDPRLCRHLHLPLQSGSGAILRRMARKTRPESYAELVAAARKAIPEVALTTDLIVGFPGETDLEFEESLRFVQNIGFAGGHVFTYSARPGTPAARFSGQVHGKASKERSRQMRAVFTESSLRYRKGFLGRSLKVLWETAQGVGPNGWQLSGLTDNYLRVNATAPMDLWNNLSQVCLTQLTPDGLLGEVEG